MKKKAKANTIIKEIILITALFVSILFSGCQLMNYNAGGRDIPITAVDVYQGVSGLEIEFLKDSPPENVYQGQTFQVSTLLHNKGAYPINRGMVIMTNEPDYTDSTTTSYYFILKGKETYDPTEHNILENFLLTSKNLESKSTEHKSIVLVTACYDYGTKLNSEVCIDTDPQNLKAIEKPCQVSDLSFSGQGAPVSISKVETKIMVIGEGADAKVKPQFLIYVRNDGEGQVISKSSIEKACASTNLNKDDLNGVILKDFRFSEYTLADMDCRPNPTNSPNPVLKLIDKEQYFVCTLKDDRAIPAETSTFKTGIYIELEYAYTITKSKEFLIKKYNT